MVKRDAVLLIVPTLQLGGQERVAVNTAEILKDEYDVILAVFDQHNVAYLPNCEVVDLNVPAADGTLRKVRNVLFRAHKLSRLKRERKIAISYSFGPTANLINSLSECGEKLLLSIRAFGSLKGRPIDACFYHRCDKVICASEAIRTEAKRKYKLRDEKLAVLYNPYSSAEMLADAVETVNDYVFSPHTIVSHGRLAEVKNYPRLIKAFSIVHCALPDAQLLIIGEGEQRPVLEAMVKGLQLEKSIQLIGFRSNPFAYLKRSTLYVLPSYAEGFPNALVEGMTFLPTVAVDCKSGPREILCRHYDAQHICCGYEEADYGILVQPAKERTLKHEITEEDHVLADAMLSVLMSSSDQRLAWKQLAQQRARVFSYEAYHNKLREIL